MQWFSHSLVFQLEKYAENLKCKLAQQNSSEKACVGSRKGKKQSEMSHMIEMVVKGQFYEEVGSWDGGKGVWEWKPKNKFSPIIFKFTRSRFKASSFPFLTFD